MGKETMFSFLRNATFSAAVLALGAGLSPSAQAGYVVTLQQVGSDVVATGNGQGNRISESGE
jgi:hypothetical protein